MTATMASSVKVGVLPRSVQARSNSSEVIPSAIASSRVTSGSLGVASRALMASDPVPPRLLPGVGDRVEDPPSMGVPEDLFGAPVRVRHQAKDVAALVAHTGDGAHRAVRIGVGGHLAAGIAVAEHHLALFLQLLENAL